MSVQAETVNQCKEIEIPAFLTGYARGGAATVGTIRERGDKYGSKKADTTAGIKKLWELPRARS